MGRSGYRLSAFGYQFLDSSHPVGSLYSSVLSLKSVVNLDRGLE